MTFSIFELSIFGGRPVWLYRFAQGSTVMRLTSASNDYSWGGYTWSAAPIKHGKIAQASETVKDTVQLNFARSSTFVQQWLGGVPEQVTTVDIYKVHRDDPDAEGALEWSGRVLGLDASNEPEIILLCEPSSSTKRRMGLQEKYMRFCRHALYAEGCNLDKADFAASLAATALDGDALTVPGAAGYADGWFTNGFLLEPSGSMRFITAHAGDQITLSRPHPALEAAIAGAGGGGLTLTLYPGCDRTLATCIAKFDNRSNHGGFPWKAIKNPFAGSSIV